MSISALTAAQSSTVIPAPAVTTKAASTVTPRLDDSVTLSPQALHAAESTDKEIAYFEKSLHAIRSKVNAYEHQVVWQLDHHAAVTGPNGTASANLSSSAAVSATAAPVLISTQVTSALGSQVSLKVTGESGSITLSFAAGTKLSALASAVNNVKDVTGVSAVAHGAAISFDAPQSSATQFVTVAAVAGSFDTTAATSAGAIAQTIAAGFAGLESSLPYPPSDLSDQQYAALRADEHQLDAEQTRFQSFVAERTTPNIAQINQQLSSNVNAFEHQATWQIDRGLPVTLPAGSNAAGDGATQSLHSAITSGFASLQTNAANSLGVLPPKLQAELAQIARSLATEQARFEQFASRRAAYRAAHFNSAAGPSAGILA